MAMYIRMILQLNPVAESMRDAKFFHIKRWDRMEKRVEVLQAESEATAASRIRKTIDSFEHQPKEREEKT